MKQARAKGCQSGGEAASPNQGASRVSPQEGLREALESLKALNQGVYDNDTLPPGQRNFAMLCIDKIDAALSASRMSEDAAIASDAEAPHPRS